MRYDTGYLMSDPIAGYLDYCAQCGLVPETTITGRARELRRLAAALPVPIAEATRGMLAAWRAGLVLSDQATWNRVTDARQFFAWLILQGFRLDNPADGLPLPRRGRLLPRPIAEEDLFAAIEAASGRIRAWLVLGAYVGLRAKEAALLRREYVFDARRPPAILVAADATKGRCERLVPTSAWVIGQLCLPWASGWLYARADGRPLHPATVSHLANRHLSDCGSQAKFHQLRHFYATTFYGLCPDLRALQELMGHKDPSSTAPYTDWCQARAADVIAQFPLPPRARKAA